LAGKRVARREHVEKSGLNRDWLSGLTYPYTLHKRRPGAARVASPAGCEVRSFLVRLLNLTPDVSAAANFGLACCCSRASKSCRLALLCIVPLPLRPLAADLFYVLPAPPNLRFFAARNFLPNPVFSAPVAGKIWASRSFSPLPSDDPEPQLCQPCRLSPSCIRQKRLPTADSMVNYAPWSIYSSTAACSPSPAAWVCFWQISLEAFVETASADAGDPGAYAHCQAAAAGLQTTLSCWPAQAHSGKCAVATRNGGLHLETGLLKTRPYNGESGRPDHPSAPAKSAQRFFFCAPSQASGGDATLLLLDDIYTTGATARACSRVLKNAGARSVPGGNRCSRATRRRRFLGSWFPRKQAGELNVTEDQDCLWEKPMIHARKPKGNAPGPVRCLTNPLSLMRAGRGNGFSSAYTMQKPVLVLNASYEPIKHLAAPGGPLILVSQRRGQRRRKSKGAILHAAFVVHSHAFGNPPARISPYSASDAGSFP